MYFLTTGVFTYKEKEGSLSDLLPVVTHSCDERKIHEIHGSKIYNYQVYPLVTRPRFPRYFSERDTVVQTPLTHFQSTVDKDRGRPTRSRKMSLPETKLRNDVLTYPYIFSHQNYLSVVLN